MIWVHYVYVSGHLLVATSADFANYVGENEKRNRTKIQVLNKKAQQK